jgi:hypothetical protein
MHATYTPLNRPQGFSLIIHTVAPTGIGAVTYILIAVILTVAHLVTLSVNGTAYPEHLNDTLSIGYVNSVIQPLLVFTNSTAVNSVLTLVLWAAAGSIVAAILSSTAGILNNWRTAREDVSISRYGVAIYHPLQHNLIVRMVWRSVIGICIAGYTLLALAAIHYCFANDLHILGAASPSEVAWRFGVAIGIWSLLLHGYVVLLRLYMQRTRIFGEILY